MNDLILIAELEQLETDLQVRPDVWTVADALLLRELQDNV